MPPEVDDDAAGMPPVVNRLMGVKFRVDDVEDAAPPEAVAAAVGPGGVDAVVAGMPVFPEPESRVTVAVPALPTVPPGAEVAGDVSLPSVGSIRGPSLYPAAGVASSREAAGLTTGGGLAGF